MLKYFNNLFPCGIHQIFDRWPTDTRELLPGIYPPKPDLWVDCFAILKNFPSE
jgi:hypothetical protein